MERIGKYEIQELIGRGGFGRVYRAWDPAASRMVALKVLLAGGGDAGSELLQRFRLEASATGALRHPNIVTVFDYGEHESTPYLAMEFLEGRDLQKHVAAGGLSLLHRLVIMEQAGAGLQHAHQHGIVHRDVKPSNIMILDDGAVKIIDFGIARLADADARGLTMAGCAIGTAAYMAPEQLRGETVDHRADIFAFGVVLRELVTGAEDRTAIPAALDRLIAKALEQELGARYQSFEELLVDLAAVRKELAAAFTARAVAQPQSEAVDEPRVAPRRGWRVPLTAAVLLLLVLVAMAFLRTAGRAPVAPAVSRVPAATPQQVVAWPVVRIEVATNIASGWVAWDGVAKGSLTVRGAYLLVLDDAAPGEHLIEVAADEGARARVAVRVAADGAVEFGRAEATPGLLIDSAAGAAPPRLTVRATAPASPAPQQPKPVAPANAPPTPPVAAVVSSLPPPPPPPAMIAPPPADLDADIRQQQQRALEQAASMKARAEAEFAKAAPAKPVAPVSPDGPAILQTLALLRAAYANKDAAALARLYPGVPKALLNSLKRDIDTLDVQLRVEGSPQVNGNVATVQAQRTVATWFKGDRTPHAASDPVTITLRRAGAAWVVESMR